jgi:tetrahydromethanopterin S-methyltransferase subunit C
MNLHTITGIVVPLVGGLLLLGGRVRRYGGDSPSWACNVLALVGIMAIMYALLAVVPEVNVGGIPYVQKCRTFIGGVATGCVIALTIAGEMTPSKWKKRKTPNHTPDGIRRPADGSPKPSV